MLNRHITQAHGPKINEAFSLCGHRPQRGWVCPARKERKRLHRATTLEPASLKPAPAVAAGGQGRFLISMISPQIIGVLVLNESVCYLFSSPAACHLLESYDSLSVTCGLLGATPFKSRPSIWLFIQSSAPKQAIGSSLQIDEALWLPWEGYIKYQQCVLFYNIITLVINP